MITFLTIITISLMVGYYIFIEWVKGAWDSIPSLDVPMGYRPNTRISVIVAVRNEAKNIKKLLQSLIDCGYPSELLEIVIIDDHSVDHTAEIVKSMPTSYIKLLYLKDYLQGDKINAYKKAALQYGIDQSDSELIITTDGDCIVSPGFLRQYAYHYESMNFKLMAGPVQFGNACNFIEQFQSIDMISMMGITGAGIERQKFYLANGANIAYDKEAFLLLDTFDPKGTASGDDMFLIQSMAKKYPGQVHFLKNPMSIVKTALEHSFSGFWQQRKRWASKSKQYNEINIKLLMVFIFIVNLTPYAMIVLSIIGQNKDLLLCGLILWIFKFIIDFFYIKKLALFFKERFRLISVFKSFVFYPIYILYTGFVGVFPSKYNWKNRSIK